MSNSIKVWRPQSETLATEGLVVPFSGPANAMTRESYQLILRRRIQHLIDQNPEQAGQVLSNSPEQDPDIYQIAMYNSPKDWGSGFGNRTQQSVLRAPAAPVPPSSWMHCRG